MIFENINDVVEWLEPLNYLAFWNAVAPYDVFSMDEREHCDGLITSGKVPQAKILEGIKTMARLAFTEMFNLNNRIYDPVDRQYLRTTH